MMVRSLVILCLLFYAAFAQAGENSQRLGPESPLAGHSKSTFVKSEVDSIVLIGPWGSGAVANGQFEDPSGYPNWNGWTHRDMTVPFEIKWQISTYHADNLADHGAGNLAAWCGSDQYPACNEYDEDGGYGNNYNELITWSGMVANPSLPCDVTVQAYLNLDMEQGYDFLRLLHLRNNDLPLELWSADGELENYWLNQSFEVLPHEYLEGNQVQLQFEVTSDGAWSDEDCSFPTTGACQIDDITVTLSNGWTATFDDFESGDWTHWQPTTPLGVGDFAQIWSGLDDIDPCHSNYTPQVAFIDDGNVVPGTGGQVCINWCYGPGGYIVNTTGGLAGPGNFLHNKILSPVIPWPESGAEGAMLAYTVYDHEDLSADSPGIFHSWHIRSTTSSDPADIEYAAWEDRNFILYGSGVYRRIEREVSDLMETGATFAQVSLDVRELGYYWGWIGDDGYPAPYFDNVRLLAFPFDGPSISARLMDLAQDGFPAGGMLDMENGANNSVRFDMAKNIAPAQDLHLDPGDSIVATISPRRMGAELLGFPVLHYKLAANPAFDDYRTSGLDNEGFVYGSIAMWGTEFDNETFAFDLPDSGFFFPGDVLHYYLEATTNLAGALRTAILPADTTGFSDFSGVLTYDPDFTVRALPSVYRSSINGELHQAATVLMWDDGGDLEDWVSAMDGCNLDTGFGYDVFVTRSPSSGVGNGLGSRATPAVMAGYRTLLYSSGSLFHSTISNGDLANDGSDDLGLLNAWMEQGGKSMFLTGDNLVSDLDQSGADAAQFMDQWMNVEYQLSDIRPLISNQTSPLVLSLEPQFSRSLEGWVAYGGCPGINTFDGIVPGIGAQNLAEFTDPSGQGGAYTYSALVLHDLPEDKTAIPEHNSGVVTMPYALQYVYTSPGYPPPGPYPARQAVLFDVLNFFGEIIIWLDAELPANRHLSARNYPNPFNPVTRIEYNFPQSGHLSLRVFDAKGRLVRTLIDENRQAGAGEVFWDGANDQGAHSASGVYFYEVKTDGQTLVNKMMLLK